MALCRENLRFLTIGCRKRTRFGIARLLQRNTLLNGSKGLIKQSLLAQTVRHVVEILGLVIFKGAPSSWKTLLLDSFPQANALAVKCNGLLPQCARLFVLLLFSGIIAPFTQQVGSPCQERGKVTKTRLLQIRMASKGLIKDFLGLGKAEGTAFC